jgi:hypothetical protein
MCKCVEIKYLNFKYNFIKSNNTNLVEIVNELEENNQ